MREVLKVHFYIAAGLAALVNKHFTFYFDSFSVKRLKIYVNQIRFAMYQQWFDEQNVYVRNKFLKEMMGKNFIRCNMNIRH